MSVTEIIEHTIQQKSSYYIKRHELRFMSEDDWIENIGSGTLRKSKRCGLDYKDHYIHERVAHEFGWTFDCKKTLGSLHVTQLVSQGDCKPITEAGWFFDRYKQLYFFQEDVFSLKQVYFKAIQSKHYIAIVIEKTSANWIPNNSLVFGVISEFTNGVWGDAQNPF